MTTAVKRAVEIVDGLKTEGYHVYDRHHNYDSTTIKLEHPNGNRISIYVHRLRVDMFKNDRLIKQEILPIVSGSQEPDTVSHATLNA